MRVIGPPDRIDQSTQTIGDIVRVYLIRFVIWWKASYTPRIGGILMIAFVALFALDVFGGTESIWRQILGFIIHAAPSIILAILMIFAWRKPIIGFIIFGLAAIILLRFVIMGGDFAAGNFILFVAPLALISALFWINWKWKDAMTMGKAVG